MKYFETAQKLTHSSNIDLNQMQQNKQLIVKKSYYSQLNKRFNPMKQLKNVLISFLLMHFDIVFVDAFLQMRPR